MAEHTVGDPTNQIVETLPAHEQLTQAVDRLSLTQAIKDFEIANARVMELAKEVIDLEQRLAHAERDLRLLLGVNRTRVFAYWRRAADLRARWRARP